MTAMAAHGVAEGLIPFRHGPTAVLAEDDPLLRDAWATALRSLGLRVREAADGIEALEAFRADSPDLLITDVRMPRMDGIQLIRKLRDEGRRIPIVVVTGWSSPELDRLAAETDSLVVLRKPFSITKLVLRLEGLGVLGRGTGNDGGP